MRYRIMATVLGLGRDLRHALRRLRARPAFTVTAVFSLALGIGANSAVFSVLDGLFLRPPAVERPGELLRVFAVTPGGEDVLVSLDDYTDRERTRTLAGIAAEKDMIVSLRDGGASQFVSARVVSENYFGVLRPSFVQGRPLGAADFEPSGRSWPAVVSQAFWRRQFESRPQVAGRTVVVENFTFTITGVVGGRFRGTDGYGAADIYLPIHAWKLIDTTNRDYPARDARILTLFARPAPGATLPAVQGDLRLVAERLARQYPETNKRVGMRAVPDTAHRVRSAGSFGWLLALVIVAILAMSCVNVANLLLAEAARQRKDFAIRQALGAGRSRLVGQLLAESLLLAGAGGAAGLGVASLLVRCLPLSPTMDGLVPTFAVDSRVALFSLALTLATSVLFGLFPALRASRLDLVPELKAAIAERSSGGGGIRVRGALIVGQLAATLVLLVATGLMLRSLDNLVRTGLGFPRKDLLTVWVHTGTPPARGDPERAVTTET